MGTVFTIDIRDPGDWEHAVRDVVSWLHHVDAVFSTYRADSDISRIRNGQLSITEADPDVATVLALCAEAQDTTRGFFSAMRQGRLDPTGLVKGWAVEQASLRLTARGAINHAVNGGGDVRAAGSAAPAVPWVIGIVDPLDRTRVLTTVSGVDFAVATSGTAERGAHIIDPFTGQPATRTASATVIGPSLTYADAYATAAFLMGADAVHWIGGIAGYAALLVAADGTTTTSSGWTRQSIQTTGARQDQRFDSRI